MALIQIRKLDYIRKYERDLFYLQLYINVILLMFNFVPI